MLARGSPPRRGRNSQAYCRARSNGSLIRWRLKIGRSIDADVMPTAAGESLCGFVTVLGFRSRGSSVSEMSCLCGLPRGRQRRGTPRFTRRWRCCSGSARSVSRTAGRRQNRGWGPLPSHRTVRRFLRTLPLSTRGRRAAHRQRIRSGTGLGQGNSSGPRLRWLLRDERRVFEEFKKLARPHLTFGPRFEIEWLSVAQHP